MLGNKVYSLDGAVTAATAPASCSILLRFFFLPALDLVITSRFCACSRFGVDDDAEVNAVIFG